MPSAEARSPNTTEACSDCIFGSGANLLGGGVGALVLVGGALGGALVGVLVHALVDEFRGSATVGADAGVTVVSAGAGVASVGAPVGTTVGAIDGAAALPNAHAARASSARSPPSVRAGIAR